MAYTFSYSNVIETSVGRVYVNSANEGLFVCHHKDGRLQTMSGGDLLSYDVASVEFELGLKSFTVACCYPQTAAAELNLSTIDMADERLHIHTLKTYILVLTWAEQKARWAAHKAAR